MFKKLDENEVTDGTNAQDNSNGMNLPPSDRFSNHAMRFPPKPPTTEPQHHDLSNKPLDNIAAQRRLDRVMPGDTESKKLIVGREIHLKGEISSCEKLVVEGCVEAELNDARIIEISSSGIFKGCAQVKEADISGRFEGELTVTEKLTVRSSGKINGVIRYGRIIIESGGEIAGEMESLAQNLQDEEIPSESKATRKSPKAKK